MGQRGLERAGGGCKKHIIRRFWARVVDILLEGFWRFGAGPGIGAVAQRRVDSDLALPADTSVTYRSKLPDEQSDYCDEKRGAHNLG